MCPSDRILRPAAAARSDFRSAFDVIDADHDGKISGDDLRMFYVGYYGGGSGDVDDLIGTMMKVADSNKNGFVEYDEFESVLKGHNGISCGGGGGLMEDMFKVMDKDGDGRLSHQDLKSYMELAGFPASDEDISAMIRLAGGDDKEGVSLDGLLKRSMVDG
uniref:Calmodulin-like protein 11 n=1 Tax=Carica papaya TaxID=3649 RepID=A0A3S8V2K1_CARPA|nr:calmodulin-like protein 11 [Carica papaya]